MASPGPGAPAGAGALLHEHQPGQGLKRGLLLLYEVVSAVDPPRPRSQGPLFGKPIQRVAKLHNKGPECTDGDKDRQNKL